MSLKSRSTRHECVKILSIDDHEWYTVYCLDKKLGNQSGTEMRKTYQKYGFLFDMLVIVFLDT